MQTVMTLKRGTQVWGSNSCSFISHIKWLIGVATALTLLTGCSDRLKQEDRLVDAASKGNIADVTTLVESGYPVDKTNPAGYTALMAGAANGQDLVVRYLLDKGADINVKGNDGRT